MGVSVGLPFNRVWNGGSDLRRGDILLGAPPNFGSFPAAKMTPFFDPIFVPPRVVNWGPYISLPMGSLDLIPCCALRFRSQVLPPIL